MISYQEYLQAEQYINEGLIRTSIPNTPKRSTRREWMLKFLDDLGHPEESFPAIHIAGTSGKGSTAVLIAEGLRSSGLKVGLHTTPYLQVATEKLWVNGRYATAEEFCDLVNWIRPVCEKWRSPETPLHGLASFGICLEYFRRQGVDIAVIEAGVGGRDDLTNVLDTKLSVITPIGIDHTTTLGETIEEIATHKAGIIKQDIPVVAYKGNGYEIIEERAESLNSPLHWCQADNDNFHSINGSIAAKAMTLLVPGTKSVKMTPLVPDPKSVILPGRMETLQKSPTVIIDGAHNAQKLKALLKTIPMSVGTVVFGMLKNRLNEEIIQLLQNLQSQLILTAPRVYGKEPLDPHELADILNITGVTIEPEPETAFKRALDEPDLKKAVLITGSLYLVGNIRELYYPSSCIVENGTSWPLIQKDLTS